MTPGAYVVVHGNIKEYDGELTISHHDMRPVEDFNQVTHQEAISSTPKKWARSRWRPARPRPRARLHGRLPPTTHGQSAAGSAGGPTAILDGSGRAPENGTGDEGATRTAQPLGWTSARSRRPSSSRAGPPLLGDRRGPPEYERAVPSLCPRKKMEQTGVGAVEPRARAPKTP